MNSHSFASAIATTATTSTPSADYIRLQPPSSFVDRETVHLHFYLLEMELLTSWTLVIIVAAHLSQIMKLRESLRSGCLGYPSRDEKKLYVWPRQESW